MVRLMVVVPLGLVWRCRAATGPGVRSSSSRAPEVAPSDSPDSCTMDPRPCARRGPRRHTPGTNTDRRWPLGCGRTEVRCLRSASKPDTNHRRCQPGSCANVGRHKSSIRARGSCPGAAWGWPLGCSGPLRCIGGGSLGCALASPGERLRRVGIARELHSASTLRSVPRLSIGAEVSPGTGRKPCARRGAELSKSRGGLAVGSWSA